MAGRYAVALFELASEAKQADAVSAEAQSAAARARETLAAVAQSSGEAGDSLVFVGSSGRRRPT